MNQWNMKGEKDMPGIIKHEYLLVGGERDGKRIKLFYPPPDEIKVPEIIKHPYDSGLDCLNYRASTYRLEEIRGNSKTYWVYLYNELTPDDLMEKLISNYRKEGDNNGRINGLPERAGKRRFAG